ncbi:MAG: NAD(P)H nitroreductase [Thermobacillus sp. ZCTH02-B1]|mgnify:FL=1|uniref:nitroreductase family protein n=1 Tax=Thermobacillus sp. ZCTH02-B1 TaxID=1858795 RepID=UPI000B55B697|nr:nitroreductase family protein [Thermobacillus sp. ZCTH02-B1]OUM95330.1 MAG: NAD(P)H nitroreductase [Thermobacillus sp. ZCTH02-B1]
MTDQVSRIAERIPADFGEVIRTRRSVRHYDPHFVLSREEIRSLIADAVLAPSSNNLQPWRFLVIDRKEDKEKLYPIANSQKQVLEASATIAVLGDLEGYKRVKEINRIAVERGYMTGEFAAQQAERLLASYGARSEDALRRIVLIDGSLAAMQLMLAARARGLDTVPMGGFDHERFIEAFRVPATYVPIMLIAVGKAAAEGRPTARLPVDDVTVWGSF